MDIGSCNGMMHCIYIHCVPDIIDCSLKKDYQFLIAHFVQISVNLAESLSKKGRKQLLNWTNCLRPFVRTEARRCFLHSLTAVSIMFCSTADFTQSLLEFIDIPKHCPIDSLLHDTANIVIELTDVRAVRGHRSGEMKFIDVILSISRHISLVLFFAGIVQKQTLRT